MKAKDNFLQTRRIRGLTKKWAGPLVSGLFFLFLLKFVFFIGYVPSSSMEPSIPKGSFILGSRIFGDLRCGDIAVFDHKGQEVVKRIAAIPGDTIYLDDITRAVSVNQALPNATRLILVPEGCYFMLGDNAEVSLDSRFWETPFIYLGQILAIKISLRWVDISSAIVSLVFGGK
jgi:signal peptidase I